MFPKLFPLPFLFLLPFLPSTLSASRNITVDDQADDPALIYAPEGAWHLGPHCTGCVAQPDPNLTFNNTWHDSTTTFGNGPYTINYTFQGI